MEQKSEIKIGEGVNHTYNFHTRVLRCSVGSASACRMVGPGFESRPGIQGDFAEPNSNEDKQKGPPYISAIPMGIHNNKEKVPQKLYKKM